MRPRWIIKLHLTKHQHLNSNWTRTWTRGLKGHVRWILDTKRPASAQIKNPTLCPSLNVVCCQIDKKLRKSLKGQSKCQCYQVSWDEECVCGPSRSGELFRGWLFGSFGAALGARHRIVPSCHTSSHFSILSLLMFIISGVCEGGLYRRHLYSYLQQGHKSVQFSVTKGRIISKC